MKKSDSCSKKKNYWFQGIIYGAGLGMIFGAAIGETAIGLPMGAGIGMVIGLRMSKRHKINKDFDSSCW